MVKICLQCGDLGSIPGSRRSPGEGNGNPFQYSCLENPMDRGTWWATVCRVTKSQTQLKWLSKHTQDLNMMGFLGGVSGKDPACQCRRCKRCRFNSWVGKIPWRRAWQPIPVFSPGKSQGKSSLAGYSPQDPKSQTRLKRRSMKRLKIFFPVAFYSCEPLEKQKTIIFNNPTCPRESHNFSQLSQFVV